MLLIEPGEEFVEIGAGEGPLEGSGGLLVAILEGEQPLLEFAQGA